MNSTCGPACNASSSQTTTANPMTAGQRPSQAGYSATSHGWIPSRRTIHTPMSCNVENGSSHCQIGPMSAEIAATPTQP